MLIGQIYFCLERTIGTIKKKTYKKNFLDLEKSDAAVTIEITYKKKFWIFEKSDAGQIFFCPRPNKNQMRPFL